MRPRTPALLLAGALLLQAAWILALPAFRGTDEFDHAYRAASVARGHWLPSGRQAPHGRGQLVVVPRDLVDAAGPVCDALPYTGHDNCHPAEELGHGQVAVASAAATYNPAFYFVVGTVARPFHGVGQLYAMRVTAALLCSCLLALASWVTGRWARTRWPSVATVASITPVVVFSTAVAAPNGLEMCAALVVWLSLLGLRHEEARRRHARALLVSATVGAVVLATLRSLGPVWLALVCTVAVVVVGTRAVLALVRTHPRLTAGCAAVVAVAVAAGVAWTRLASTNSLEPTPDRVADPVTGTLSQLPLWFLQAVAAFPRRMDAAPPVTYLLVVPTVAVLLWCGWRAGPRRLRAAMLLVLVVAVAVPVAITIPTIEEAGPIWQGRYGLPFHVGLTLLAGLALDENRSWRRWVPTATVLGAVALVVAHVAALLHVLAREKRTSPLAGTSHWVEPPAWTVALLFVGGFALWAFAARIPAPSRSRSASVDA